MPIRSSWRNAQQLTIPRCYVCGHCGHRVTSDRGLEHQYPNCALALCTNCDRPTEFLDEEQTPGVPRGMPIAGLSDDLGKLYEEARRSGGANAPTACVMACRKILLHVARDLGAQPKDLDNFKVAVEFMIREHHVPKGWQRWVDAIRKAGNEANHEIVIMTKEEAEQSLKFTEMLLRTTIEFPGSV
jgi:hypothetical protein